MSAPAVIDVHAHLLIPELAAAAADADPAGMAAADALDRRRQGEESFANTGAMIQERWALLTDTDARLAAMDASGVDVQVVSPSPNHYYPFLRAEHAVENARRAAEAIAGLVAERPDRFVGLGLASLSDPEAAVESLKISLAAGLRGVEIGSYGFGRSGAVDDTVELSDPALEPLWELAAREHAVIFLHPLGCSLDARLDRFYLGNAVAQPTENAVAISHLIFSGVLDRHPDLRIIAAHAGGYLPTVIGRSDRAWEMRAEARVCAEPPSAYLSRMWFDSLTHDPMQLRHLVERVGADRVVVGSDFPFDMGSDDPAGAVRAAGLGAAAEELILAGNATSLGLAPYRR